jgi:hypothetical protein
MMNSQSPIQVPGHRAGERGSALIMVLMLIIMFGISIAGVMALVAHDARLTRELNDYKRAMAAAEAGLDKAIMGLRNLTISTGAPTQAQLNALTPPAMTTREDDNYYVFESPDGSACYSIAADGAFNRAVPIEQGRWAGLTGDWQMYVVRVGAVNKRTHKGVVLTHTLQRLTIPVFQFGVFYGNDLEINPGANMNLLGAVHTNRDLYLTSSATLTFDKLTTWDNRVLNPMLTTHGKINVHRKDDGTYPGGAVKIRDDNGVLQAVYQNNKYLENTAANPNWASLAWNRWTGNVTDTAHNVPDLQLPIPSSSTPSEIKNRAVAGGDAVTEAAKFENKAAIKICRNSAGVLSATTANGAAFALSYTVTSKSGGKVISTTYTVATTGSLSDFREGTSSKAKVVNTIDINVGTLINHPDFPSGGGCVVYAYTDYQPTGTLGAVRLSNGATLPANGMTIATNDPVYVQGDYNTLPSGSAAKPSLIVGDAMTILSNAWNDSNSAKALSSRVASNTTVESVVMTGNTETTSGHYNGGLENLFRFLEDWGGKTMTFSGSIICLWNSSFANSEWRNTGSAQNVYNPPTRNWSYDSMYSNPANKPPGIPPVFGMEALTWAQGQWTSTELY